MFSWNVLAAVRTGDTMIMGDGQPVVPRRGKLTVGAIEWDADAFFQARGTCVPTDELWLGRAIFHIYLRR
jgi:hypothetical protein